jgi:CubicO group peptidase (beta-lactamase class C family)
MKMVKCSALKRFGAERLSSANGGENAMISRWAAATFALALITSGVATAATSMLPTPAVPAAAKATAGVAAEPSQPPAAHALTAEDVAVFFDGLVPYALHRGDIAGATIAVVKDGQLLFAQGYGFADLKTKKPVIADETLFRTGSTSKAFTWTAVMQLVEQGKLNLDSDVNTYLDFKIPEKFGKPITLRNLMTHAAGFEEAITDLFLTKPEQLYSLHDYLVRHMPERIFPPGKVVAYSNYGATLAAYIVQRVSGEPFADYVANHVFKPIGILAAASSCSSTGLGYGLQTGFRRHPGAL